MKSPGELVQRVRSQPSYVLSSGEIELAMTVHGAMMAPVTFFADSDSPIRPYAVAPWADEPLPEQLPGLLARLRGDFFCSAFGGNAEPWRGRQLPPHGETANEPWTLVEHVGGAQGCRLTLSTQLALQGGSCTARTVLLPGHPVIYQRHDFGALEGPLCPGHHAILQFPARPGSGILSFSRHVFAHTDITPPENPENGGYSWLAANREIEDLTRTPCLDGSVTDLTRYPARRGFEDVAMICADPSLEYAWSCAVFPAEGYLWFSLRDPRKLASTVLWSSNAGRHWFPFNGRTVDIMGIEDVTSFFDEGLTASVRDNLLSARGIRTHLRPEKGRLSIPYIQGVARVPGELSQVVQVERDSPESIRFVDANGRAVSIFCCLDFALTGHLPGWMESAG